MRTKTLLLTAVLGIAGAVSSSAQVYSVNAVGYVNVVMPRGFSMIANPLKAADNKISALLPTAPAGATIYKFNPTTGSYNFSSFDDLDNAWSPDPNITLSPGDGAFITTPVQFTNTFVGEVMTGSLTNPMPAGFSIVSSQVPQEGRVDTVLGFPGIPGATIYQFNNATGGYVFNSFDDLDNAWSPAVPTIKVGESFWIKLSAPANWTRTFNINQP
jgi:hypothetical protein